MTLSSIQVERPVEVAHGDATVMTSIFKHPVIGAVSVHRLNLDGDGQADLVHHGGEHKAVYAYSQDHYPLWCQQLARNDIPHGTFGENLTVAGLDEAAATAARPVSPPAPPESMPYPHPTAPPRCDCHCSR